MNKSMKKAWLLASALTCALGARAATVTVLWDAVTTNADAPPTSFANPLSPTPQELTGYRIYYRTTPLVGLTTATVAGAPGIVQVSTGLAASPSVVVTGLLDGTSYYFRVTALDQTNQSDFSLAVGDLDVDVSTFTSAPATPTGVAASAASYQQVNVTWTDASGGETGFRIERSVNGAPFAFLSNAAASANTGSLRTHQDTTVSPSTTYSYRVRANGTAVDSAFGGPSLSVTTPAAPANPPVQPSTFTTTSVTSSQINLRWNDAATDETGYELGWSLDQANWNTVPLPAGTTFYNHSSRPAGTLHYYRVRAVNGMGNPAYLSLAAATTAGALPGGFTPPPGLKQAYAYPNPAVGADPRIRSFMGGVDSIEVTIFDQAGQVVHSGRSTSQGTAGGEAFFEYVWTGEKATGVYYAVIHGRAGDETVRARAKFAVVR